MTGPIRSSWARFGQTYTPLGYESANFSSIFAWIAGYFDSHPGYVRIASNYGVNGSGFGFRSNGPTPRGGAFGVWRNVSSSLQSGLSGEPVSVPAFDFCMVLGTTTNAIDATSSWLPGGQIGIWYTIAYHSSSAAWNGTTANNGQDNWTGTPWKSGSIVLCRANGSGSIASVSLNALSRLDYGDALPPADGWITGDNDTIFVAFRSPPNNGPNAQVNKVIAFGGYQRLTASMDVPLMNFRWGASITSPWIPVGSTTPGEDDGGIATFSQIGVKKVAADYSTAMTHDTTPVASISTQRGYYSTTTPDRQDRYMIEWPVAIAALEWNGGFDYDNWTGSHFVLGGYIPNLRVGDQKGIIARRYAKNTRIALGFSAGGGFGLSDVVITLPWDSGSLNNRAY